MKAKFTKGEWRCCDGTKFGEQVLFVDVKNKSAVVCRLTKQVNKNTILSPEDIANAHLIAAAPDMYNLLQKFLPMDEDGNGWDFQYNEGSEHLGKEVINLLKKARGE